jgi:hypothetical protein
MKRKKAVSLKVDRFMCYNLALKGLISIN